MPYSNIFHYFEHSLDIIVGYPIWAELTRAFSLALEISGLSGPAGPYLPCLWISGGYVTTIYIYYIIYIYIIYNYI
jgi:hypothetical protein